MENKITFKDTLTNKTYTVPTSMNKVYTLYRYRYLIGLSMIGLLFQFNNDILWSSLIGISFIVVSELFYRLRFLKKCTLIPNPPKQKKETIQNPALIANVILYFILGIALAYYTYSQAPSYSIAFYILSIGSVGIGIMYLLKLTKK